MKTKLKAAGLSAFVCATVASSFAHAEPVKAVVELFTSQGCSSCPPADKVLGNLVQEEDVLALAWHVDYWDYIGWKDTFASAAYSDRQRSYARHQRERMVYTPQAMVNGRTHMNGAADAGIRENIELQKTTQQEAFMVIVDLVQDGEQIRLKVPEQENYSAGAKYSLSVVRFEKTAEVDVLRGENTGRKLTYHNIVRDVYPIASWEGKAMDIALPDMLLDGVGQNMNLGVIVQSVDARGDLGPIVGAAKL